jgi:hypothetical protein
LNILISTALTATMALTQQTEPDSTANYAELITQSSAQVHKVDMQLKCVPPGPRIGKCLTYRNFRSCRTATPCCAPTVIPPRIYRPKGGLKPNTE